MIFARVGDILHVSERNSRIDQLVRIGDERIPLMISGHRNRTHSKFLHGIIGFVGLSLEDTRIGTVCFLDLAHHDGLQFAPRVLQIEVSLRWMSSLCGR